MLRFTPLMLSVSLLLLACSPRSTPATSQDTPPPTPPAPTAPTPTPPAPTPPAPTEPAPTPREAAPEPDDLTLERTPGLTPPPPLLTSPAPQPHAGLAGSPGPSPAMGADDAHALVQVYVFSDFQCPVCRRVVEPLKKLIRAYPDVQVIFKQHPLAMHPRAHAAAAASLAAYSLNAFWPFHDRLFATPNALTDADLLAHAAALGLDPTAFSAAAAQAATSGPLFDQIRYESAQAEALALRGTPGFVIGGETSMGWGSYAGLAGQVERALQAARAQQTPGTTPADAMRRATRQFSATNAAILFGD